LKTVTRQGEHKGLRMVRGRENRSRIRKTLFAL
jgi:hypothetical protein